MIWGRPSSTSWPKAGGDIVARIGGLGSFLARWHRGLQGPLIVSRAEPKWRTSTEQKILLELRNKARHDTSISKYCEDA